MRKHIIPSVVFAAIASLTANANNGGAQLPKVLSNAYVGLAAGYFNIPFSNKNLTPGYSASSVTTPDLAARVVVGDQLYKNLGVQISLMRPIKWVRYNHVNGATTRRSVWLSIFGVTIKPSINITPKLHLYGEGGFGLVSRHGFSVGNNVAMPDLNLGGVLVGGGIEYKFLPHWGASLGTLYMPGASSKRQPHTFYAYSQFNYYMHPLADATVARSAANNALFPRNLAYISIANAELGYGPLSVVSAKKAPIFFKGEVRMHTGYGLGYERMVFHTAKHFSLNVGANVYKWQTKQNKTDVYAVSVFPNLKFWLLNTSKFAWYINYEIAGPTYLSKDNMDGWNTGKHFIFQDFIGTGVMFGGKHKFNIGAKIIHYSNGNLFPQNPGVETPVTIDAGMAF